MNLIERIDKTTRRRVDTQPKLKITKAEGYAVLRAIRRGVIQKDIARELGINVKNLSARMGSWAIKYCNCGGE